MLTIYPVTLQVDLVGKAFNDLRQLLLVAAACKKPDQAGFEKLLAPLQEDLQGIARAKENNRKDREWFTHMSAIAEGAPCVGWVTVVSCQQNDSLPQGLISVDRNLNLAHTFPKSKTLRNSTRIG